VDTRPSVLTTETSMHTESSPSGISTVAEPDTVTCRSSPPSMPHRYRSPSCGSGFTHENSTVRSPLDAATTLVGTGTTEESTVVADGVGDDVVGPVRGSPVESSAAVTRTPTTTTADAPTPMRRH